MMRPSQLVSLKICVVFVLVSLGSALSSWSIPSVSGQSSRRSAQPSGKKTLLVLEISANSSAASGSQQRWMKALQKAGANRVSSRTSPRGETAVEESESGGTRLITVRGFLEGSKLELPGGTFRIGDIAKIHDLLQKFRDDGKETTLAQKHDFGLTADQLVDLAQKLAKPITEPTKGKPFATVVNLITRQTGVPFARDASARAALAGQERVSQEFQGMSSGTALAVMVKPLGLVLEPNRKQGQAVQVHIKRAEVGKQSWPAGRDPEQAPIMVEPNMFQKMPIGIKNYPLDKVMAAVQQKAKIPFLYDEQVIAAKGVDVAGTKVSISNKNGILMSMIGKLLRQTKPRRLSSELRVDDAGKPFLWITVK